MLDYFRSELIYLLLTIPCILLALPVHEVAHGFMAYKLGDPTAKTMGRLTLNPLKHFDPIGTLCMLFFHFGWARPVPIDTRYFKKPKRDMVLVSLAGPFSNLILAFAALFLEHLLFALFASPASSLEPGHFLLTFLGVISLFLDIFVSLNVAFAVFNLIPIPPLDGSHVAQNLLSRYVPYKAWAFLHQYGRYILLALLWLGVLSYPISWAQNLVFSLISKLLVA